MPIDAILLGVVIIGFLTAVPVGIGMVLLMLWGTTPKQGRRRA